MIFICYRREDTSGSAGRIFDRLAQRFGADAVFRDVDTVSAGDDFRAAILQEIESSRVLLALIGPRWSSAEGRRRLDDEDDLVRVEIATALDRGLRVIPVLLHDAAMPKAAELPGALAELASRNAIEIRDTTFDDDVGRLVREIERQHQHRWTRVLGRHAGYAAAALTVALLAGIWGYAQLRMSPDRARQALAAMGLGFDAETFVRRAADNDGTALTLYLRAGMQPDAPDRRKTTALMHAAAEGHLDVVRQLVAAGADVNGALPWAVSKPEVLEFLLSRKPGADAVDAALISAARYRTRAMRRLLDAGANVNARRGSATALIEAARTLNADGVRLLLGLGAEVDPEVEQGWLPLHHVVYSGSSDPQQEAERLVVARLLVEHGASLEARTRSMQSWQPTPLLLAIEARLSAVALFLVERGADVEVRTDNPGGRERTALMWAAEKGLPEVVQALLGKGARVDARNDAGETALIVAAGGIDNFGRNQAAVARALLAAGADIEARTKGGASALVRAAAEENGVLAVLLESGANPNQATSKGWTALMVAAASDRHESIGLLLGKGADPNFRNVEGDDAPAIAAKENSRRAVEALRRIDIRDPPRRKP